MNRFQRRNVVPSKVEKPKLDLTEENFPDLPMSDISRGPATQTNTDWISAISSRTEENIRRFSNGDAFVGDYDKHGNPSYGKLMFANGNTYYGPIFTSWPNKGDDSELYMEEIPDPTDKYSFVYYDYIQDEQLDTYRNYGEMVYPDGRTFSGVFCFDDSKWSK